MAISKWVDSALDVAFGDSHSDVAKLTVGSVLLAMGGKATPLYLFQSGLRGLEADWRERNEFHGSLLERWAKATDFYASTHVDPTNRVLHLIGIPMIVGGTAGLLILPSWTPPWGIAWASFTLGWTLNLVGHRFFERNTPAFADDPLSFLAGPVWDMKQIRRALANKISVQRPSFFAESSNRT